MRTQAQRDAQRKASAAAVAARRRRAAETRARAARRAEQVTPGHDLSCGCERCEAALYGRALTLPQRQTVAQLRAGGMAEERIRAAMRRHVERRREAGA